MPRSMIFLVFHRPAKRLAVSGKRLALSATRYSLLALISLSLLAASVPRANAATLAVSPYVEETLKRADDGIANSLSGRSAADFALYELFWLHSLTTTFTALVDIDQRVVQEQLDLLENTACLRADLFLIEAKIEEVRGKMREMYRSGNILGIWRLQSLVSFLNKRYSDVLRGARDPRYEDLSWNGQYVFEASARLDPPMCPFTTEYLPPSISGYGCYADLMRDIADNKLGNTLQSGELAQAIRAEADALDTLEQETQDFFSSASALASLKQEIDALLGLAASSSSAATTTHKVVEGCAAPAPADPWPEGAVRWELRSMFAPSPEKDERKILRAFREQKQQEGQSRPAPKSLQDDPDEGFLIRAYKWMTRLRIRKNTSRQGEGDAISSIVGLDPLLQARDALMPFSDSVARLGKLATNISPGDSKRGLRDFVRDYAYFLRRTCLNRPCNLRLDQVLKIIFQDSCFPYTNGEYMDSTVDYEKCRKDAGIP